MTKMPSETFKAQQAAKARAAVKATRATTQAPTARANTNTPGRTRDSSRSGNAPLAAKRGAGTGVTATTDPTQAPRPAEGSTPPAKTTKVFRKTTATNKCPHCTAEVAYGTERCRCGYQLISRNTGMVGLNVSEGDRKAMAGFKKTSVRIRKPD